MFDVFQRMASGDDSEQRQTNGTGLPTLSMRVVESAGFVALVTAILYFMGYSYYAGFFGRLSLPSPFPELSTSDYFLQAFSSLSGLIVAVLVSIPYRSIVPTTIREALWVNSAFIIMPLILARDAHAGGFLGQGLALVLGTAVVAGLAASRSWSPWREMASSIWCSKHPPRRKRRSCTSCRRAKCARRPSVAPALYR